MVTNLFLPVLYFTAPGNAVSVIMVINTFGPCQMFYINGQITFINETTSTGLLNKKTVSNEESST